MKADRAPVVGGMITSTIHVLISRYCVFCPDKRACTSAWCAPFVESACKRRDDRSSVTFAATGCRCSALWVILAGTAGARNGNPVRPLKTRGNESNGQFCTGPHGSRADVTGRTLLRYTSAHN